MATSIHNVITIKVLKTKGNMKTVVEVLWVANLPTRVFLIWIFSEFIEFSEKKNHQ